MPLRKILIRVRGALAWRLHRLLGDRIAYGSLLQATRCWRRLLRRPLFIGVAGSAGKTTTKDLLVGMLAHQGGSVGNRGTYNNIEEIAMAMLKLRPTHRAFVSELSEDRPGAMDRPLALLRPTIGIVTVVGNDHWSAFGSRGAIASEISKLVTSLPASGTAVLNADDDYVLAMTARCVARIITYGISPEAELRAEDISSDWPDRLQLTLVRGAERVKLRTQLCGTHWIPSALGAVGAGLAAGMTLKECAEGIASVAPFDGRMQPVTTPEGVTFIRDDFKAPLWTVDACFAFMKTARAKRKIIVIGELQDTGPRKGKKYEKTAMLAQEIADITVFVGPWASSVLKARNPGREEALRAFSHVRAAAAYINSISRDGDLILLKGANKQDHLYRIILARTDAIACWRDDCERFSFCNECPDRTRPSGPPLALHGRAVSDPGPHPHSEPRATSPDDQIIVGLGNDGSKYAGTPHNVGYEVVDRLAVALGLTWDASPNALIARGSSQARRVCLVKIRTFMNRTGEELKQLSESMSFNAEQCILVHDDLDTPIGSIRTRLGGGAGGHRGVASILEAFQTDAFRRVKVGVGQPQAKLDRVKYVLTPFDPPSRAAIDSAIVAAESRALELARRPGTVEVQ